jgi:hypothetical protein
VPPNHANVYVAAVEILNTSPEATAALSRRLLQTILRDEGTVAPQDLAKAIDEIISRGNVPTYVTESLDAVRSIGNFGAHPIKSKSTGEIVPVEPNEAEWNLDALLDLFDYYFVAPAAHHKRKDALNKKLADAGRPAI